MRGGFVYKTDDDLIAVYQPGRGIFPNDVYAENGVRGTADDRSIPMVGLPSANAATRFPAAQVVMNVPNYGRFKTVEVSLNKSATATSTLWNFKANATYDGPLGLRFSPVLRHQSGTNFARTGTISAPTGLFVAGTGFFVEPSNANREDDIWVADLRLEKNVNLGHRVRVRGMFDLFNITNSHASETISRATGLGFLKPSAILAPLTARLGFRLIF